MVSKVKPIQITYQRVFDGEILKSPELKTKQEYYEFLQMITSDYYNILSKLPEICGFCTEKCDNQDCKLIILE